MTQAAAKTESKPAEAAKMIFDEVKLPEPAAPAKEAAPSQFLAPEETSAPKPVADEADSFLAEDNNHSYGPTAPTQPNSFLADEPDNLQGQDKQGLEEL